MWAGMPYREAWRSKAITTVWVVSPSNTAMLVAEVRRQTITRAWAVKDRLESLVGRALKPIAMSIWIA